MQKLTWRCGTVALVVTAAAGLGACASAPADTPKVTVTMSEFTLKAPETVPSGSTTFVAHNVGGAQHEMVMIRGAKTGLPTKANGAVDEAAIESRIVGEIEKVKAQTDASKVFTLSKGTYTLICNAESMMSGTKVNHYAKGMVTEFTVT